MTIPACSTDPDQFCHVGCFDDVHVRGVARQFAQTLRVYLQAKSDVGPEFYALQKGAIAYARAIRDPRSERAWPDLTFADAPCDPGGWCANASQDDMADLYFRLRGPVVAKVCPFPGGLVTVAETATFRLPVMKPRPAASAT